MARPRGRTKTARLTVNLEPREYASLLALARREDVPLAWLIRRAVNVFLSSQPTDEPLKGPLSVAQPSLTPRVKA